MARDISDEKFSLKLTPERAQVYRDEADRCYGGDLSAALSAAVEHWALDTLRAHGVAAVPMVEVGPPAGRTGVRAGTAPPEADWDLTDPHMD